MEDRTLVLTMEDGKQVTCDILFTYHSEQFNKDYVIFQPRGEEQLSAASYEEESDGKGALHGIETEEEWNMLEELVNDYYSSDKAEGCSGNCGGCSGCGTDDCDCDGSCGE
ncbi:MAG: DUF1292 domain-containing protein [Anaeroplasmataceae bacterium]|nr:DUF1292 domain-containing protein [Anaeroplasmataceae bacterium]MDE6414225.1 DUF1292 domain-containing protein [Anaeroplasmataceae bacterium]